MRTFRHLRRLLHKIILFFALCTAIISNGQTAKEFLETANNIYASNPDSSLQLSRNALNIAFKNKDIKSQARAWTYIARYHLLKSDLEKVNHDLSNVYMLLNQQPDLAIKAHANQLKANFLGRTGKYEEEINLLEETKKIYITLKDTPGLGGLILNLSHNYLDIGNYNAALDNLQQFEKYFPAIKDDNTYFFNQNYGTYHFKTGNFKKAIDYYTIALDYANKNVMTDSYVTCLMLLSMPYREIGEFKKSESLLLQSKLLAKSNKLIYEESESLRELVILYKMFNKDKEALHSIEEKTKLDSTIFNIEKANKITEFEQKLKLSEKEKIIANHQLELIEKRNELLESRTHNTILFFSLMLIALVAGFSYYSFIKLKKLNKQIEKQHQLLKEKNDIIEHTYNEIKDSLVYSKNLQQAILPSEQLLKDNFKDLFVLYKPKDIVSGDFYWFEKYKQWTFIAVTDCTGHGVPGAMLSVAGSQSLSRCVLEFKLTQPGEILDKLHELIVSTFSKGKNEVNDGMDISLIAINKSENKLLWAGAYNPLWQIKHNENTVIEYKANKQPIGKFVSRVAFTTLDISFSEGDSFYLFTDGYADQFGGDKGKKFKYATLQKLLTEIKHLEASKQLEILDKTFLDWKRNNSQIDDVCVLGFKI